MKRIMIAFTIAFLFVSLVSIGQTDTTYAERLGFPKGARVVILHVDDMGMSFDSNTGGIEAMTQGVSSSCSVMMPCPWVPAFVHFLKDHPNIDAGLHLTLTSEWKNYRWGPLSGKSKTPGLVDAEGDLWPDVASVLKHATPDEIEAEIRAQLDRARSMGFEPTHMDSHMGTLFASPAFIQRYIKVGMENKIPVMFPAGHNTLIAFQMRALGVDIQTVRGIGKTLWNAGLPVLDDLFNDSYGWSLPSGTPVNDDNLRAFKTKKYMEALHSVKPGVTMIIMHCTRTSEIFSQISDSGPTRRGDLLAMLNPELKAYIEKEGIIITTWRELMQRRTKIK